jgi:NAD(P)H-hydrate epimerase
VLSIDIPSGLCATTGSVIEGNAIIANVTVTFIVFKQGLLTGQAANYIGELILADIELGHVFTQLVPSGIYYQQYYPTLNRGGLLPERLKTSHKGNIGQILALGGGTGTPGAIRLASEAALRSGAALVAVCCQKENQALVFNGRPELMLAPSEAKQLVNSSAMKKAKVLLLGPGLGQTKWSKNLFNLVISEVVENKDRWLVLDADGLTLLSQTKVSQTELYCSHWILTPHPKEAAILLGCDVTCIEADRFSAVQSIAKKYGGICILKGAGSLISNGNQIVINSTGNAGMASGGMGDVLSGIVAALVLQTNDYFAAACLAAYIHGAAGDIIADSNGQRGMLASDLFVPLQKLVSKADYEI